MTVAAEEMRDRLKPLVRNILDAGPHATAAERDRFRTLWSDYLRSQRPDPDSVREEPTGFCHECDRQIIGRTARSLYCSQRCWKMANWKRQNRRRRP